MKIQHLFQRDILRPINGVVKADQLDDTSVWQELDEFVVTKELRQHFQTFFTSYCEAIQHPNDSDVAGKIGVWISGFFGSGKSHFIKVLSYLLRNGEHHHDGETKKAVDFFADKIEDAMLFGDIKRAVASHTDVILFNIDSKADNRTGRDALLAVFLRVLNEMQGYSGDHPHIAHLERYLESKDKRTDFHKAYRNASGNEWITDRDAYHFHRDEVVKALTKTLTLSQDSAEKWVDGAEESFALTVENFCKWVKQYLDSKGNNGRLIFLVDEVGQFIGTDSQLMLNLQTITENLGTICGGRAWMVVTAQEDIDAVLGEMKYTRGNDFSKIQGRFRSRLSLSSANVDEVIQARLLAKRSEVVEDLQTLFAQKGDILKNQLTFTHCGMTFKSYKDGEDFARNYPFSPYQFQLVQRIFEVIRKHGATGLHLSRGERSILDAFQSAGKQAGLQEMGILVPLYRFYPSIESFLDTSVKRTIDQAKDNSSLEQPFDIYLLQVLFLIRYVEEVKGNVENLVTLCLDEIDMDRLALRRMVEKSLQRLEKETLINRSGDNYFFLTNEERDINREIKTVDLNSSEETKLLGELVFQEVLKEPRKYRYPVNKMDFSINRMCDRTPIGNRTEGGLQMAVLTPMADEYERYDKAKCILESSQEEGYVLVRLGNDERLGRELRTYLQTEKYVRHKNDGTIPETTKRILRDIQEDNQARRGRLVTLFSDMVSGADYYVAGQSMKPDAGSPTLAVQEAMEYLVRNTFSKMGYLKRLSEEPEKELQAVLRSNDIMALQAADSNQEAIEDLRNYVDLCGKAHRPIILHDMIEKRYANRPYGWPSLEVALLVARLLVLGELNLILDSAAIPVEKAYDPLITPSKWRRITVTKRKTADPHLLQQARMLGKELFSAMGPDGEDPLYRFLTQQLKEWESSLEGYRPLAETGKYPGREEITDGLNLTKRLLADQESFPFLERFMTLKQDLLKFADEFRDLNQFYTHQRSTWEKLQQAYEEFQLNRLELDRESQAASALTRMQEILKAPNPYGFIKEAETLIATVSRVNTALITEQRKQSVEKIRSYIQRLEEDLSRVKGAEAIESTCLQPLEKLLPQVEHGKSLAHLTQAENEARNEYDRAVTQLETFVEKTPEKTTVKKQRIIEPAKLVQSPYIETEEEAQQFLNKLQGALKQALENHERIQIR